ncbi:EAL domain-containing protein [Bacillus sp. FJAT-22090]|uniref:sensor domain-containing protein n=1 Tax=Bacillus sp. FJAT-22090 TaxID=1581038 RepID=UPI0011A4EFE9|nr:EAL domain-containing protein [Bacillus sp. FJAT-22090]
MYKKIIDSLQDSIALINVDGEIIVTNKSWQKFCKETKGCLKDADIAGINYLDILSSSNYLEEYNGILAVLKGEIPFFRTTYTCLSQNWYTKIVNPLIEKGKVTGATITRKDISEYEKERIEIYADLENMSDAFLTVDKDWQITYINKEAEKLLSAPKAELLGEDLWEVYPDAIDSIFNKSYSKTMNERVETRFEAYYDPLKTWFEIYAYPKENGGISIYFNNINEKKVKEDKLWNTAHHDHLTEMPNRLLLLKRLEKRIVEQDPFVLFFLDLNNFKHVNDAYGHEMGDILLLEIASRLKRDLSDKFFISRYGGDEFVLCTTYIDDFQVQSDAYRILSAIEKPFNNPKLPPLNITASIGISLFPENGDSADSLITAADIAMYEAKKIKGDQWIRYESVMSKSLNRRLIIEKSLKEAILTNAYYTVFQPQVNILENEIIGIEVLSRWKHPELGFISPDEFITIAEETGQIRMLTEHIIDTSLLMYNKWKKVSGYNGGISINVSSSLLNEPSFVSFLMYQLEKHSIPRGILEIEITENVQIFSSSIITHHMHDIQKAGIRIAIDDFGVGYSNLSYINNLPISKIKIDKFFTNCIGENAKGEAILQAIIVLANNLKMDVLAEGVETEKQRNFLKANNCSLVQGFFYDMPLNEDQFSYRLQQFGIKYPAKQKGI